MIASSVQAHATLMGSSTCERVVKCPGSVNLIARSPLMPPSNAAIEGTAQHAMIEHLLLNGGKPSDYIDSEIAGVTITAEHATNVTLALASIDELCQNFLGDQYVELTVRRSDEVFGTADFVAFDTDRTECLVADHKFGWVEVQADNYQGKFIASTLLVDPEFRELTRDVKTFQLAVIQPSFEPAHVTYDVSREEIEQFSQTIELAITTAKSPDAPFNIGKWCSYCPAKLVCPAWAERVNDLIDKSKHPDWSLEGISRLLHAAKELEKLFADAKERAKHELVNGRPIPPVDGKPGWRLTAGRTHQEWSQPPLETLAHLRWFGLTDKQIVDVISPAQAKKLLKGVAELDEIITKSTSAPSLALDRDVDAPAIPAAAFARAAQHAAVGPGRKR